jgi:uncharacterized protein (DUF1697 family)
MGEPGSRVYVALLRGINVGGRNVVPMVELRALLSTLGLQDVETYIQSGNAVFRAEEHDTHALAARIERAVAGAFAAQPAVLLRTSAELGRVAHGNPYISRGIDPATLHVVFLDAKPETGAKERIDPERSPPDKATLDGCELYLHLPNGAGRTKLTLDYLERTLGVRATQRNWRTVLKLAELAGARDGLTA